ncbi:hypothetical protein ZWY2020_000999 [Hordeum vulgare]|nr:hypothetical protein ZWY2020_000999 [Hordeum vulgare]
MQCYLHNRYDPPIVHCDVKPGNVQLGDDMTTARIGDLGHANSPSCCSSTPLEASGSLVGRNSCAWCAVQSTARRGACPRPAARTATESPSWRSLPERRQARLRHDAA